MGLPLKVTTGIVSCELLPKSSSYLRCVQVQVVSNIRILYIAFTSFSNIALIKGSVCSPYYNNHTLFSEESGEIALSVLSHGQPSGTRADIEQTRKQWQLIRSRYHPEDDPTPRQKKFRMLGSLLLFLPHFSSYYYNYDYYYY